MRVLGYRIFLGKHKTHVYSPKKGNPQQIKVTITLTYNLVSQWLLRLLVGVCVRGYLIGTGVSQKQLHQQRARPSTGDSP